MSRPDKETLASASIPLHPRPDAALDEEIVTSHYILILTQLLTKKQDINNNHVGVNINSLASNGSATAAYFTDDSTKQDLNIKSGKAIQEFMFVGFSASTGLLASSHHLLGWSFKINRQALALDLSSLPSLPGPKKNHIALIVGVSVAMVILAVTSLAR
ncbi:L-type lectin-domain containing receptor kinase S.4-like [Corylus avellana]|uniref:L-type lectin-domain containing receptor kinase S.4-like n=1 Tax=Corylus avellana TaxID=13451 RepID=UPI00286AAAA0|nr:L-type lectin-domain containing receptor kinase S.4-like [Corylus avellana]